MPVSQTNRDQTSWSSSEVRFENYESGGYEMHDFLMDVDVNRLRIYPPPEPAKVAAGGSEFGDGYLGFSFGTSGAGVFNNVPQSKLVYAVVPHWAVAAPLACWTCWRFFGPAAERRRRLKRGLCLNCGYDMRASEGRCPECGERRREHPGGWRRPA